MKLSKTQEVFAGLLMGTVFLSVGIVLGVSSVGRFRHGAEFKECIAFAVLTLGFCATAGVLYWTACKESSNAFAQKNPNDVAFDEGGLQKKVKSWPHPNMPRLNFSIGQLSLNNVRLGDDVWMLERLGRPEISRTDFNSGFLLYPKRSLRFEITDMKIDAVMLSFQKGKIRMTLNDQLELSRDTTPECLIKFLGKPSLDESDDEERCIEFKIGECLLSFDFEPKCHLSLFYAEKISS